MKQLRVGLIGRSVILKDIENILKMHSQKPIDPHKITAYWFDVNACGMYQRSA